MLSKYRRIVSAPILLAAAVMVLCACGAGVLDSTTTIAGDYRYVDTGGNGRYVARFQEAIGETIVIGARVDKIEIDNKRILIARRPRIVIEDPQGSYDRMADTCEYWYIDVQTHRKGKFDPGDRWPNLKCRMEG
jgi:hypothetical protein